MSSVSAWLLLIFGSTIGFFDSCLSTSGFLSPSSSYLLPYSNVPLRVGGTRPMGFLSRRLRNLHRKVDTAMADRIISRREDRMVFRKMRDKSRRWQ
jgi:hypothetical protein